MTDYEFDEGYWEEHWRHTEEGQAIPPNPHLMRETAELAPGTALEAGCGEGAEARWLATQGWRVTAADISTEALARAAAAETAAGSVEWVQADLSSWRPDTTYDLVTTHYAHPAMPQLDFYRRVAEWVAPGGTLLVVGHLATSGAGHGHEHNHGHGHGHGHENADGPPPEAAVTSASVAACFAPEHWEVVTAEDRTRTVSGRGGEPRALDDVVVRVRRRPA